MLTLRPSPGKVIAVAIAALAVLLWGPIRAKAAEVELTSGERLMGQIVTRTDRTLTLDHAILGRLSIPIDQVRQVHPDRVLLAATQPATAPATVVAPYFPAAPQAGAGAILEAEGPSQPGRHWQLDLGFTGAEGNTNSSNLHVGLAGRNETPRDRWKLDAAYDLETADQERQRNQFTAGAIRDWLLPPSAWFYFVTARYDYDQFQDWDQRISGSGGPGYQFLRSERLDLVGRLGAGATREFGGDDERVHPEGYLGGELNWRMTARQRFVLSTEFYPDFLDLGQFHARSNADWIIQLVPEQGLSLKLGLQDRYESNTGDEARHNDLLYRGSLMISF